MKKEQKALERCVFFDRDGVVNRSPGVGWVTRWEDFELLPGFVETLRIVRDLGYETVVITNQSAIGRGLVAQSVVEEIHAKMREQLVRQYGLDVLDVFYCPHVAGDACDCRKPLPGMFLWAAAKHGLDLSASWMVGDQESDIQAGRRAGCRTILVSPDGIRSEAEYRVRSMDELKSRIAEILGL